MTELCRVCVPSRPFGFYSLRRQDRCGNEGHVGKRLRFCPSCRERRAVGFHGYCSTCSLAARHDEARVPFEVTVAIVSGPETVHYATFDRGYPAITPVPRSQKTSEQLSETTEESASA